MLFAGRTLCSNDFFWQYQLKVHLLDFFFFFGGFDGVAQFHDNWANLVWW